MENLKIRVNSEAESKEAQELFFQLGGSWAGYKNIQTWADIRQLYLENDCIKFGGDSEYFEKCTESKEITLPELRAMVNPMKEYLVPQNAGGFMYKKAYESKCIPDSWIEIPEGAIRARFYPHDPDELEFENAFRQWWYDENKAWFHYTDYAVSEKHSRVVWQRDQDQDEPFLTPECTLNDQYAEIEQVGQSAIKVSHNPNQQPKEIQKNSIEHTLAERQSTYGDFEDVAFVTENIMHILAKVRVNGLDDLPHTHRMALYMIASKMARIVNGDFNHLDSWHDIGGYAKLIEKLIKGE